MLLMDLEQQATRHCFAQGSVVKKNLGDERVWYCMYELSRLKERTIDKVPEVMQCSER